MEATARSAVDSQIVTGRSGPLLGPISTNRADNLAWCHFMVPPRSNDSKADMAITSKPCGLHCKVPRLEPGSARTAYRREQPAGERSALGLFAWNDHLWCRVTLVGVQSMLLIGGTKLELLNAQHHDGVGDFVRGPTCLYGHVHQALDRRLQCEATVRGIEGVSAHTSR
jgi:hypothetical protein